MKGTLNAMRKSQEGPTKKVDHESKLKQAVFKKGEEAPSKQLSALENKEVVCESRSKVKLSKTEKVISKQNKIAMETSVLLKVSDGKSTKKDTCDSGIGEVVSNNFEKTSLTVQPTTGSKKHKLDSLKKSDGEPSKKIGGESRVKEVTPNITGKISLKQESTSSKDDNHTEEASIPLRESVIHSTKKDTCEFNIEEKTSKETTSKQQLLANPETKTIIREENMDPITNSIEKEGKTTTGNEQAISEGKQVDTIKSSLSTSVEVNELKRIIDNKVTDIPVRKDGSTGKNSKDSDSISTAATSVTSARDWGLNRNERKNKKMMRKLGMKRVLGITRATFKTTTQGIFYIENPDVYRQRVGHQSIVIFGQTYRQDSDDDASTVASHKLKSVEKAVEEFDISNIAAVEEYSEGEMCEDGLKQDDIEVVISQALCTRNEAVVALRENNGDLVNAIMELTT